MKNKKMLCLLLCVSLFLCGCAPVVNLPTTTVKNTTTEAPIPNTTTPPRVTITVENGQYLLEFSEGNSASNAEAVDVPTFSDLGKMKAVIEQGKFTEAQIKAIKTFSKDANGKIKILDPNNLYEVTTPEGFKRNYIAWRGKYYDMDYVHEYNEDTFMGIHVMNDGYYERSYEEDHKPLGTFLDEQADDPERNAKVYSGVYGDVIEKYVVYDIVENGKTLHVLEKFMLGVKPGVDPTFWEDEISETVPYYVKIWGEQDGVKFTVGLFYPKTRPTLAYLSQFGLIPYVEE